MRKLVLVLVIAACSKNHQSDDPSGHDAATVRDAAVGDGPLVDAQDATVTADAQVTAMMVGTTGGTLTTPDGVVLTIPPGALATDTTITITVITDALPNNAVSKIYALEPDGTQFSEPVTLTLPYDPNLLGGSPETDLALATLTGPNEFAGTGWALIDAAHDTATGYITHFSTWAIVPVPPGNCFVNYGCVKACSASDIPDVCCSAGRSTCRSLLHSSFQTYVGCYAQCVGAPQVANFGNSTCMAGCCTGQGGSVIPEGACYLADATLGQAQAVLDCARNCFDGPDQNTMCGTGNIQFDACRWTTNMSGVGGECVGIGSGVNMQFLFTTLRGVLDQIWGNPPMVHVTGGSLDATSISIPLSCATAVPGSGLMTGSWTGTRYEGTYSFGTGPNGVFSVEPDWPLN